MARADRILEIGAVLLSLFAARLSAQGTRSDYERAEKLPRLVEGKVLRARIAPRWLPGGKRFSYERELPGGGRELVLVDAERGLRLPASEAERREAGAIPE
ncbi:MAG: hypothetical protein ACUVYA_21545, partial [Planctomycetota bacterium]